MKKIISILFTCGLLVLTKVSAQTINWESMNPEKRQMFSINVGWDYGFTYGLGYSYMLKSRLPIILKADFSSPAGHDLMDDFKTKLGAEVKFCQKGNFIMSAELLGVFRRYENSFTRLLNFGSSTCLITGYHRPGWFVDAEFGFDKAIVTHFSNSEMMREIYPNIQNGWYEPATGGNANFGLRGGLSIGQSDLTMKLGKLVEQDFKTDPLIPFYFQLGYNRKF